MTCARSPSELPVSKSLAIRWLFASSFCDTEGQSTPLEDCDDVRAARRVLRQAKRHETIDCGEAASVLRFAMARVSRLVGRHVLTGSPRLLERPHQPLMDALTELGVRLTHQGDRIVVEGEGWCAPGKTVLIDRQTSSQYVSALLLCAWDLPFSLEIGWIGDGVSDGYAHMTIDVVRQIGMRVEEGIRGPMTVLTVPASQHAKTTPPPTEPDMSCVFALAAAAAVRGELTIPDLPWPSMQPDASFVAILQAMGAQVDFNHRGLRVLQATSLQSIDVDLRHLPDLFPVLAMLCGMARGASRLHGAPHLAWKESNRLTRVAELLQRMNRRCTLRPDGLDIEGRDGFVGVLAFDYDPRPDHRLVMAAGLAQHGGCPLRVTHPEAVNKSFPTYWDMLREVGA